MLGTLLDVYTRSTVVESSGVLLAGHPVIITQANPKRFAVGIGLDATGGVELTTLGIQSAPFTFFLAGLSFTWMDITKYGPLPMLELTITAQVGGQAYKVFEVVINS